MVVRRFLCLFLVIGFLVSKEGDKYIIVIDAGHGGEDPGCIGLNGLKEKEVTLLFALKLGQLLKDSLPVKVYYTRETDSFVTLYSRATFANKKKADLFISIHCNSACRKVKGKLQCNQEAKGMEIYVLGLHRTKENLEVAMRENSVIMLEKGHEVVYENFDPSNEEHYIMLSLKQNLYLENSIRLAEKIIDAVKKSEFPVRNVNQAGFWVLYKTAMPSILIELDYLTTPAIEANFRDSSYMHEKALAVYRGVKEYLTTLEKPANAVTALTPTTPTEQYSTEFRKFPDTGLFFGVQILATFSDVPSPLNLGNFTLPVFHLKHNEINKYIVGYASSYREILPVRDSVKSMGFEDSFIVAVYNGEIIPVDKALSIEKSLKENHQNGKKTKSKKKK